MYRKGYCRNPGQSRVELSNLEWYYYQKLTTTTPHHTVTTTYVPLQYTAIPHILAQSKAEQS